MAHVKVPQVGTVVVEDVEIGAAPIDRATVGDLIGAGSKIDNLVQVGTTCARARGAAAAQVGISGSATLEDRVTPAARLASGSHRDRPRRDRGGAVGGHELGRAGPLRHRLPGDGQSRVAQSVGGVRPACAARAVERRSNAVSAWA
jgi:hypothetical protein